MYGILLLYAAQRRGKVCKTYYIKGRCGPQELGGERWLEYPGMKRQYWG